jgi:exodeoxyribonuclease-3
VWDPSVLVGATHGSDAERAALAAICDLGLSDVFREHHDEDGLFSWWDYRDGNFHKRKGMRIDLALVSASVSKRTQRTFVDRSARKGKSPSDHAPVVVDLADR